MKRAALGCGPFPSFRLPCVPGRPRFSARHVAAMHAPPVHAARIVFQVGAPGRLGGAEGLARASARLAQDDDGLVLSARKIVGIESRQRQVDGVGNMARGKLVRFANVDDRDFARRDRLGESGEIEVGGDSGAPPNRFLNMGSSGRLRRPRQWFWRRRTGCRRRGRGSRTSPRAQPPYRSPCRAFRGFPRAWRPDRPQP